MQSSATRARRRGVAVGQDGRSAQEYETVGHDRRTLTPTRAGNRELLSKSAIAAIRACLEAGLSLNCVDTGLQGGQVRPAPPVQRKFPHGVRSDHSADVRTGKLNCWSFGCDLDDRLGGGAYAQGEVADLLSADR